jgi:hypothetical protein
MFHKVIQKARSNPRLGFIIIMALMLPIAIIGVYLVQSRGSRASAGCAPENIHTERTSQSSAHITFDTTCSVAAKAYCAVGRDGAQFLCGEDEVAATKHVINTSKVTLSSDTAYFVFIDTQLESRTLSYIQANPVDSTVGLDFNSFNEETVGLTNDEAGYDVSLDINQDGVVNGMDRSEFYPEYKQ